MFQTVLMSIIRSSKLHIQRQVFVRPLLLPAASLARSRYSDWAAGWTAEGSKPDRGEKYFLLSNRPDRPRRPPKLLFNVYRGYFPGVKRPGLKLTSQFHQASPEFFFVGGEGVLTLRLYMIYV